MGLTVNERIKELDIQAQYYANEQNDKHGVSWIRTYKEKFAELIVQECATLMAEQKKYYADPGKYETMEYYARMEAKEDAFSDAEVIIKQHFGVES